MLFTRQKKQLISWKSIGWKGNKKSIVMDKSEIMAVVTTIREQLITLTNSNVLFSWGIQGFVATIFNEMATLKFRVNGRLFKGDVLICYNTLDYYEIYLSNEDGSKCICNEAYYDNLGDIIDTAIESGTNKKEYEEFCHGEWFKLLSGQI
jgi:hypothetical protein BACCOPRO_01507